jgi:hypothetical protein
MRAAPGRLLPAVGAAILAATAAAAGGERPEFHAGTTWQEAQASAAASRLAVLVRVVEAGKPEGKGWDGNFERVGNHTQWTSQVEIDQQLVVEVSEVLHGSLSVRRLKVKLGKLTVRYRGLSMYWSRHLRPKNWRGGGMSMPAAEFALRKDGRYVLFLEAPEAAAGGGEPTAAHAAGAAPVPKGDGKVLKSVRAFCKVLNAWENPPELGAEDRERVRDLIARLGHQEYEERAEADRQLRELAPYIRPYLTEAAEDPDLERAVAAERIMADFAPVPGKHVEPKSPPPPPGSETGSEPEVEDGGAEKRSGGASAPDPSGA